MLLKKIVASKFFYLSVISLAATATIVTLITIEVLNDPEVILETSTTEDTTEEETSITTDIAVTDDGSGQGSGDSPDDGLSDPSIKIVSIEKLYDFTDGFEADKESLMFEGLIRVYQWRI